MVHPTEESRLVRLSVVVPAFNCQDTIEACLLAIRRSAYQDYELIVADDGSSDGTADLARKHADKLVLLPHAGRTSARKNGLKVAEGQILVNVDSDVLVTTDTLSKIAEFFKAHPLIEAVTGCLEKNTPDKNFFSQYKNLYMYYTFRRLPENVAFLYGSIHALRAERQDPPPGMKEFLSIARVADDTALGQSYAAAGKPIFFLKDLQVTHLKKFTLVSFIQNDFHIPFDWAKIFLHYQGWRQIGKNGTGYCHSPKEQLISVVLAPLLMLLLIITACGQAPAFLSLAGTLLWLLLNLGFLVFLAREKGPAFGAKAILVTFLDHLIMATGIVCGSVAFMLKDVKDEKIRS